MNATTTVNCRGLQCPEPVLRTARAARQLAASGGLMEVLADDEAFPADVKSWCTSSGATLVSLDDSPDGHRAVIRIPARKGVAPVLPIAANTNSVLDCRGKQCPEPVLSLARFARANPGAEVEVLADDPAFPVDVDAWCRSSGATEISRSREGDVLRVRLRVASRAGNPSSRAPSSSNAPDRAAPSAPAPVALAPAAPAPSSPAPGPAPSGSIAPQALFDLRGHGPGDAVAECARIAQLGSTMTIEVMMPDPVSTQDALRAFTGAGHDIVALDLQGARVTARLRGAAVMGGLALRGDHGVQASSDGNACTILVLHNDLENLLAAFIIANGAAAAGQKVMMFFTFWGLNVLRGDTPTANEAPAKAGFFQRVFKWLMPKGSHQPLGQYNFGGMGPVILGSIMRGQKIADLPSLVESASELGVRFVACTMSMSVMGMSKRDLRPYPNLEYAGVASFVESSRSSRMNFVF